MNGSSNGLGVVLLPEFGYRRGQLFMAEHACLKKLSSAGMSVDRSCCVNFDRRLDSRDTRPLTYRARIATGVNIPDGENSFRHCSLWLDGRTKPAEQLAASSMEVVEDCCPEALPSTASEAVLQGARKFEQLGASAWHALMDASLDGLETHAGTSAVVIDANMSVGDSWIAWQMKQKDLSFPFFYIGLCDDGMVKDWFLKVKTEQLAKDHMEGRCELPGSSRVDVAANASILPDKPSMPTLNILVQAGKNGLTPCVPQKVMEECMVGPKYAWCKKCFFAWSWFFVFDFVCRC